MRAWISSLTPNRQFDCDVNETNMCKLIIWQLTNDIKIEIISKVKRFFSHSRLVLSTATFAYEIISTLNWLGDIQFAKKYFLHYFINCQLANTVLLFIFFFSCHQIRFSSCRCKRLENVFFLLEIPRHLISQALSQKWLVLNIAKKKYLRFFFLLSLVIYLYISTQYQ